MRARRCGSIGRALAFSLAAAAAGAAGCTDTSSTGATVSQQLPLAWLEQEKLTDPDGAPGDRFAAALSIGGSSLLVGAPGNDAGTVSVFERVDGAWFPIPFDTLTPEPPAAGTPATAFGSSIAAKNTTAIIGMRIGTSGAADVFNKEPGGIWKHFQRLVPAPPGSESDLFGAAVANTSQIAVVGAPGDGAAYVYRLSAQGEWSFERTLGGEPGAQEFGAAVATDGDSILVGAPGEDTDGANAGAAYVFVPDPDQTSATPQWDQPTRLSGGVPGAQFGTAVAIEGDWALVGAPENAPAPAPAEPGEPSGGAVYAFTRSNGVWEEPQASQEIRVSNSSFGARVGSAIALSGTTAVIGAPGHGKAYVFTRNGSLWSEPPETLFAADGVLGAEFGNAVAFAKGSGTVVGAHHAEGQAGAAYAFVLQLANGAGCKEASQCGSGFCVDGVCCEEACDGLCEACSDLVKGLVKGSGTDGACGPIEPGFDPDAECDEEADSTCGRDGTCDGNFECRRHALQGTECRAASCVDAFTARDIHRCDGFGMCVVPPDEPCGGSTCQDGECKPCASDDGCFKGYRCLEEQCVPKDQCASDQDCSGYVCSNGTCRQDCSDTSDCADGYTCNASLRCLESKLAAVKHGGCAVSQTGERASRRSAKHVPLLWLLGVALLLLRSRKITAPYRR